MVGSIVGSIAQGAISKNKDYNLESFGEDIGIGVFSFGISEGLRIFGEKVVKGIFNYCKKHASLKVASELSTFLKTGRVEPTFTFESTKIIKSLEVFDILKNRGGEFVGVLYSFFNSLGHGTIFESD